MSAIPYMWIPIMLLLMVLAVISLRARHSQAEGIIDCWARANKLTVLQKESRILLRGPMSLNTSRNQLVYKIRVSDQQGRQRTGWVRCGGRWIGMYSDQVEARWD